MSGVDRLMCQRCDILSGDRGRPIFLDKVASEQSCHLMRPEILCGVCIQNSIVTQEAINVFTGYRMAAYEAVVLIADPITAEVLITSGKGMVSEVGG